MGYKKVREDCYSCDGTGRVESSVSCDRCGGSGLTDGFFVEKKICGRCDGSGRLYVTESCSSCDGRGYTWRSEWEDDDSGSDNDYDNWRD